MAEVTLHIGGHNHSVTCRDGEETHLLRLAAMVDGKAQEARAAVGGVGEVKQLLLASLLLADQLTERTSPDGALASNDEAAAHLEQLAEKIELLAAKLEKQS